MLLITDNDWEARCWWRLVCLNFLRKYSLCWAFLTWYEMCVVQVRSAVMGTPRTLKFSTLSSSSPCVERAECYVRCDILIIISLVLDVFRSRLFWRHQFVKCWTSSLHAVSLLFEVSPTMVVSSANLIMVLVWIWQNSHVWIWSRGGAWECTPGVCLCWVWRWMMCTSPSWRPVVCCWGSQEQARRNRNSLWDFLEGGASLAPR